MIVCHETVNSLSKFVPVQKTVILKNDKLLICEVGNRSTPMCNVKI